MERAVEMKNNYHQVKKYYEKLGYIELETFPSTIKSVYLQDVIDDGQLVGKSILEIGAGASMYRDVFLEMGAKNYTGVELVEERIPLTFPNSCSYICGPFEEICFQNKFDYIFTSLTYMYMNDRDVVLQKIKKLLNFHGCLVMIEPNYFSPLTIFRCMKANIFDHSPNMAFSPYHLKKSLEALGFEVNVFKFFVCKK